MNVCMYGIVVCVLGFFTLRNRAELLGISPDVAYYLFVIAVPMIIYCYLYFASKLPVSRNYFFGEITRLNREGFRVGNILDDAPRKITWDKVTNVKFDSDHTYLEIYFERGNVISIRKDVDGFYNLLERIPARFTEFDFEHFKRIIRRASTCDCCGHIAYVDGTCLHCYYSSWDKEVYPEYLNAKTYLKEMQLEYFSTLEKDDPVIFYPVERDELYKFDSRWRPIVTEDEVLQYSKENEWS